MDYYTTSSLVYTAAAIEQGFEGINGSLYIAGFIPSDSTWRFPKTPHNVALMEARSEDYLQIIGGHYHGNVMQGKISEHYKCRWTGWNEEDDYPADYSGYKIIQRNNKPFPVWDKE
jgi:hypothetical protein